MPQPQSRPPPQFSFGIFLEWLCLRSSSERNCFCKPSSYRFFVVNCDELVPHTSKGPKLSRSQAPQSIKGEASSLALVIGQFVTGDCPMKHHLVLLLGRNEPVLSLEWSHNFLLSIKNLNTYTERQLDFTEAALVDRWMDWVSSEAQLGWVKPKIHHRLRQKSQRSNIMLKV